MRRSTLTAFVTHANRWGLQLRDIARIVGASERTLRRKCAANVTLEPAESDRLARVVATLHMADDFIGSHERALSWMRKPSLALGGVTPLSMLSTDAGVLLVQQSLGATAYGGFA